MRKLAFIAATAALAAVPAVALGQSPPSGKDRANAARLCQAQRKAMGDTLFRQTWGTNSDKANAFGKCVSKLARAEQQARLNASKQCRAEQSDAAFAATHDGKTFAQFYGTNANGSNAFGNCVSLRTKLLQSELQTETVNPARLCRAQQASMGSSLFATAYGENASKRNAFGKCVSTMAHVQHAVVQSAVSQCRDEQADPTFAANHGGKTFTQFYGTNANGSNAFVNCVLQKIQQLTQQVQQQRMNAAKACDAERRQMGDRAFRQKYGTGPGKSNAFGRCVEQHANR
jgi:hypothetical protein